MSKSDLDITLQDKSFRDCKPEEVRRTWCLPASRSDETLRTQTLLSSCLPTLPEQVLGLSVNSTTQAEDFLGEQ